MSDDPKALLDNVRKSTEAGLAVNLEETIRHGLQTYIEKQNRFPKTRVAPLKLNGENPEILRQNMQLAQDLGLNVDISSVKAEHLPQDKIACQLQYKYQTNFWRRLFRAERRVPDFEATIEEEMKLAEKGVKLKLADDINVPFAAYLKHCRDKGKKEKQEADQMVQRMNVLISEVAKANVPRNFEAGLSEKAPVKKWKRPLK